VTTGSPGFVVHNAPHRRWAGRAPGSVRPTIRKAPTSARTGRVPAIPESAHHSTTQSWGPAERPQRKP
jgi:hypothetical protein